MLQSLTVQATVILIVSENSPLLFGTAGRAKTALRKNLASPAILAGLVLMGKPGPPSSWLGKCGNPASFAGFPSAVETVEKSVLDFSTVSTARHFPS